MFRLSLPRRRTDDETDGDAPSPKERKPWRAPTVFALLTVFVIINFLALRGTGRTEPPSDALPVVSRNPTWLSETNLAEGRVPSPHPSGLASLVGQMNAPSVGESTARRADLTDALLRELEIEHRILSDSIRIAGDASTRGRLRALLDQIEAALPALRSLRADWIAREASTRQTAAIGAPPPIQTPQAPPQ
jgi:hypothetical protein